MDILNVSAAKVAGLALAGNPGGWQRTVRPKLHSFLAGSDNGWDLTVPKWRLTNLTQRYAMPGLMLNHFMYWCGKDKELVIPKRRLTLHVLHDKGSKNQISFDRSRAFPECTLLIDQPMLPFLLANMVPGDVNLYWINSALSSCTLVGTGRNRTHFPRK